MKKIASVSLSGGQGKSTLVFFTSKLLAALGYRVLVIDLDPQHNISTFLRVSIEHDDPSVLEFIKGETLVDSVYSVPDISNLYVIPADDGLELANDFLAASGMGVIYLRNRLQKLIDQSNVGFDFCLIDTPPQKSQLCKTGIGASDYYLIPAEPEAKGVLSLDRTLTAIDEITDLGIVQTQLLGVLPFRDQWFGLNRSLESQAAINQMSQMVAEELILPSFRDSTVVKKSISQNKSLAELGKPELAYPFEQLVIKLESIHERSLSKSQ